MLTLSRVGVAAAVAVVLLWLALSRGRHVEGGLLLAASAIPAALVGGWAFTRPALVEDVADRSDRVADGAVLGVLTLAGAGLVAALVAVGSRGSLGEVRRRRIGRALLAVAALGVFAVLAGGAVAVGNAVSSDTSCAEVVNDPSRLGSLDVSNRWCWWNEAVDVYAGNAPEGAGAGTFEIARKRYRSRCAERHAAAQRAPAAACRGRASRARVVRRVRDRRGSRAASLRCAGSTEASALPPPRSWLRPSRISCTRSSTTTGTSSP